jgi:hypothetical protein
MDASLGQAASLKGRPPCRPSLSALDTDGTEPVPPIQAQATSPVSRRGETKSHLVLKRLALLWAQENGYPIAALEVSLPQCRYRADVAAYRPQESGLGHTAVFECKQSAPDLRRDDCRSPQTLARLESVYRRRQILEKHLRIYYPPFAPANHFSPNGTHTISRRSNTAATPASHASWPPCKASCVTDVNSKNLPITLAPLSFFSSYLTIF